MLDIIIVEVCIRLYINTHTLKPDYLIYSLLPFRFTELIKKLIDYNTTIIDSRCIMSKQACTVYAVCVCIAQRYSPTVVTGNFDSINAKTDSPDLNNQLNY